MPAFSQPSPTPVVPLKIKQNGTQQGYADTINCTTGMTCSVTAGTATVSSNGGGGGSSFWLQSPGNVGINTTQNVGIGSVSPKFTLDVNGSAGHAGNSILFNDGSNNLNIVAQNAVNFNVGSLGSGYIDQNANIVLGATNSSPVGADNVILGYTNTSGNGCTDIGNNNTCNGNAALAQGSGSIANATGNIAMQSCQSTGQNSICIGNGNTGHTSNGVGSITLAACDPNADFCTINSSGLGSVAIGLSTGDNTLQSNGQGAVAIGQNVQATSDNSVAIGNDFTNSTPSSIAFGSGNTGLVIDSNGNTITSGQVAAGGYTGHLGDPFSFVTQTGAGLDIYGNFTMRPGWDSSWVVQSDVGSIFFQVFNNQYSAGSPGTGIAPIVADNTSKGFWTFNNTIDDGSGNMIISGQDSMSGFRLGTATTIGFVLTTNSLGVGSWQAATGDTNYWLRGVGNVGINTTTNNVGIGTISSINTLNILNNVGIGTQYDSKSAPVNSLIVQGNIGIGTWAPNNSFDIVGGEGIGSAINSYVTTTTPTGELIVEKNVGIGTFAPTGQLEIEGGNVGIGTWTTSGGQLIVSLRNGNVGIGTITPSQALDIHGTVRALGALINGNVGIGSLTPSNFLDVTSNQNSQTNIAVNNSTSGTAAASQFVMNGNSGNQGTFGLTSPLYTAASSIQPNQLYFYSNTANGLDFIANNATGPIVFATGGLVEKDRIDPNGNIGIGSVSPGTKLDVTGEIRSSDWSAATTGTILCKKASGGIGYCATLVGVVCSSCT